MNGDSYSRDGGRSSGSRNYSSRDPRDPRDDRRDRGDGGDRRRRRSRSPRHGGGRRDYEVDTYSSSRDYREREREDTYNRRERREERGADRGGDRNWGDSYSRRDRPRGDRDRDRGDDDRGSRRDRGDRGERGGDRFDGERRGGRGPRDGGAYGGGRDRGRPQKEESPPPNKAREATPDLSSFISIQQRQRRMTQWDIKPAGYENITAEQAKLSGMFPLPGAPRAAPMDPSKLAAFMTPSAGTATAAALAPAAAKQSKRLYVHNLPPGTSSEELMDFFNLQMNGVNVVSSNDPCLSANVATSKEYAAMEFKTAEDATFALAMNGISMRDDGGNPDRAGLSIRRPKDYITPTLDENAYPAGEVSSLVKDGPYKLSIVNIPPYIEEDQVRELIETMGLLNAFAIAKDSSDQHRGIAFCEYIDRETVDDVIEGLNGIPLGDTNLKVARASVGIQQTAGLDGGVGAISMLAGATAPENRERSRVICLMNMVTSDELINDDEYEEIKEDIEEECGKYGPIIETKIPRPAGARINLGVGKIYIKYQDNDSAQKAIKALAGRQFSRRTVVATEFSEEGFDVDAW